MASDYEFRYAKSLQSIVLDVTLSYGETGATEFSLTKGDIQTFSMTRQPSDNTNTWSLTVIGDLSYDMEVKIATSAFKRVYIQYGFTSDVLRAFIGEVTEVSVKFQGLLMALSVSGIASQTSVYLADTETSTKFVNSVLKFQDGLSIKSILNIVCDYTGWTVNKYLVAEPLSETYTKESGVGPLTFLRNLGEEIQSEDGISGYIPWLVEGDDKIYLNYYPEAYLYDQESTATYVYDLNGSSSTRLISFEVSDSASAMLSVGSAINAMGVDDDGNLSNSESSQEEYENIALNVKNLYSSSHTYSTAIQTILSVSQAQSNSSLVSTYYSKMNVYQFEASAELIGDTSISVYDTINIVVLLNNGDVHYTSGIYLITSITDKISSSGFITKLELLKMGSALGVD